MIWHLVGVECINSFGEGTVHFSEVFSLLSCYLGGLYVSIDRREMTVERRKMDVDRGRYDERRKREIQRWQRTEMKEGHTAG
jgi:hypothetical protein